MHDTSLTFDPPARTANTPPVSRRQRAWVSPESWRDVVALVIALALHAGVLFVTWWLPSAHAPEAPTLRAEEASNSATIPLEVFEDSAGAAAPAAAAPAPRREPAPISAAMAARIATIAQVRQEIAATAAAVAAQRNAAPVDLSHLSDVRGVATAGAVTTAGATGVAGAGAPSGGGAGGAGASENLAGGQGGRPSLAQPVRPTGSDWRCPWPAQAHDSAVYQENVIVRVVVNADGSVVSAQAQGDPGFGFAAAAEACARRESFSPARDASGQPVRATSPAIRVRFSR